MIIWLVAIVVVGLAALIGYFMGGIRSAISLVGAIVAAYLAGTVGAAMAGLTPKLGFENPVWQFYIPPLLGFVVVSLIFGVLAFVAHHLFQKRIRLRLDEYGWVRWVRLNRRTGAALGAALGCVWFILLGIVAYVPGYLTTQLADQEETSGMLKTLNSFTHGMEQTGMNRIVERYQPADETHFKAANILGLIYNNPSLHSRLASYPPFLGLSERPEIAELSRDPNVNTMLQSRASLGEILQHERIRALVDNHDLVNEFLALDIPDLEAYLRTGVSEKFKDEAILGRWKLNKRRSIAAMSLEPTEKLPRMELNLLRRALNVYLDRMVVGFTTDNRAMLRVKASDPQKLAQVTGRPYEGPAPAAAESTGEDGSPPPAAPGSGPGLSPRSIASRAMPRREPGTFGGSDVYDRYGISGGLDDRYGVSRGGSGGGAAPGAAPLASGAPARPRGPVRPTATTELAPLMVSSDGTWSRSGDGYRITFREGGATLELKAEVRENRLVATINGRTLVFDRI